MIWQNSCTGQKLRAGRESKEETCFEILLGVDNLPCARPRPSKRTKLSR